MKLTFIGAAHEVTGSCHYLEIGEKHILVDYGMEQGVNTFENAKLPIEEAMVDYVFLTHAHDDHAGFLNEMLKKALPMYGADYLSIADDQKQLLGALINNTKALAALFGKTIGEEDGTES